jgi:hypothetical protein
MPSILGRAQVSLLVLAAFLACRTVPGGQPSAQSPAIGASSSRAAVDMYMKAMREVDFTLIGNIWGSRDGLARDRYSRQEFEKRAFVVSCYLGWTDYRITTDRPAVDNGRTVVVQSTASGHPQQATLRLEQDSSGRWFVAGADLSGLAPEQCTKGSASNG